MSTIRPSKAEAKTAEAELLGKLQARAGQLAQIGGAPATVRALLEGYAERLAARGKSADSVGRATSTALAVERLTPALLETPVGAVTDADIFTFRQARVRASIKPSTINRDMRTLRAALKAARPEYRFPGGAFFPEDETRVRWLRPDEELLVLEPMPSPFREICKLAALTLMRQSEIRTLRREMVHLEQGVVLLPRAKGGARPVILSQEAQKIVQGQLEAHDKAWVFPGPDGVPYSRIHVSRVFRKAARAAGLRDFHFHDLRHHGATMALNAGFTAPIVMQLGGWKTEKMMRRYAAVTDQTLRAAAEAVSGNQFRVAGGLTQ
jgi:integrase